jgi:hypothetical protein
MYPMNRTPEEIEYAEDAEDDAVGSHIAFRCGTDGGTGQWKRAAGCDNQTRK